jgi:hypothetical protein
MPERIRLSRAKGWSLPDGAVNVARPGKWGNPFVVGKDGTREQCVAMFAQLARGFINLGGRHSVDEQITLYRRVRRSLDDLKGRDLACWCALDGKPCHGDVLLSMANGTPLPAWAKEPIDIGRVRLGMTAWDLEAAKRKRAKREQQDSAAA